MALGEGIIILASECKIVELKSQEYKNFVSINHISYKDNGASIKYGLKHNGELVSIMSFKRHCKYEWQIIHELNKLSYRVVGGISKSL
jgi:hypothetical protein